jgi:hypothetical protein
VPTFNLLNYCLCSRDSSVGIAVGYRLDDRVSIPGTNNRFFFYFKLRPDRLCGPPSFLGYRGQSGRRMKLTTHLHLVPMSKMVEL